MAGSAAEVSRVGPETNEAQGVAYGREGSGEAWVEAGSEGARPDDSRGKWGDASGCCSTQQGIINKVTIHSLKDRDETLTRWDQGLYVDLKVAEDSSVLLFQKSCLLFQKSYPPFQGGVLHLQII